MSTSGGISSHQMIGGQSNRQVEEQSSQTCCLPTKEKVMKVMAVILIASAVALIATIAVESTQGSTTAMYTISGIVGIASLIGLAVTLVKSAKKKEEFCCTTTKTAMKVFAAIAAFSIVAIAFTALIHAYPEASTAIYTTGGILATITFVALMILGINSCTNDEDDEDKLETDGPDKPSTQKVVTPPKPSTPPPAQPPTEQVGGKPGNSKAAVPPPINRTKSAYDTSGENPFEHN